MAKEKEVIELRVMVQTTANDFNVFRIGTSKSFEDITFVLNNEHYDYLIIDSYCFNKKKIITVEQI